jgi:competence CoiA-like predicted nuclease
MILYDYAIDSQELIIHINEIDSQNKSQYKCIECNSEMIARTGEIKEWHFAHKNIENCSGEGYLHKLAKRVFFENKSMQIINYKEFIFPMLNDSKGNLSDVFDIWEYEKTIGNYRADILLSSSKHDYKVMIEIRVTHGSSQEKIESGIPIIEIRIQNQKDIENLKLGTLNKLIIDYHNILASKTYRFHTNHIIEAKKTNCKYYKYEDLKYCKSMVIDCISYKQTKQIKNQCEFCSYHYE